MANKRMFSKDITEHDDFLDMPLSAQMLYVHLCMNADDDGFVSSVSKVKRIVGIAGNDELKLLIAKKFLISFESGIVVVKHWRIHNTLSKTRYKETNFLAEKSMLLLKDNNAYSLTSGNPINDEKYLAIFNENQHENTSGEQTENKWRTSGEQVENKRRPQNRIDKNRIDKNRLDLEEVKNRKEENRLEEDKNNNKGSKDPMIYFPNDEILNSEFLEFIKMRKKIRKPLTDHAIDLALKELNKLSEGDNEKAIEILRNSIKHSWSGLYPLKKDNNKGKADDFDEMLENWAREKEKEGCS